MATNIREPIPVSTTNEIPGYEVTDYIGDAFGLVVLCDHGSGQRFFFD